MLPDVIKKNIEIVMYTPFYFYVFGTNLFVPPTLKRVRGASEDLGGLMRRHQFRYGFSPPFF